VKGGRLGGAARLCPGSLSRTGATPKKGRVDQNGQFSMAKARQAKRAGPDRGAGPEVLAVEARKGRDAERGSMRSTTARPAMGGDALMASAGIWNWNR
jgi:hypothetical protein